VSARDEVLARVRAALGDHARTDVAVARDYDRGSHATGDDDAGLLDLLDERLTDYRARVRHTTPDEVADAVAQSIADGLAHGRDASGGRPRIVVPPALPDTWTSAIDGDVVTDDDLTVDDLDRCDGVVTAAAVAIAETGTIVLDGSSDQGRRAITLVPDLHVCVVHADQVVAGVPQGVARLDPTRPLTWISGPSATSDIELDRVEGVHGPRTLEVVLVDQPVHHR
jgi:L-lactate dehydrogenase complex protein LldG